jgi:hypothetical protein
MGHIGNPKGFRLANPGRLAEIAIALKRSGTQYADFLKSEEYEAGKGIYSLNNLRLLRVLRKKFPKRRKNKIYAFRWGYAFYRKQTYFNVFLQNAPGWQGLWHTPYNNYGLSIRLAESEKLLKFLAPKIIASVGRRREQGYATHGLTYLSPAGELNATLYVVDRWQRHFETSLPFAATDLKEEAVTLGYRAVSEAKESLDILFGELKSGIAVERKVPFKKIQHRRANQKGAVRHSPKQQKSPPKKARQKKPLTPRQEKRAARFRNLCQKWQKQGKIPFQNKKKMTDPKNSKDDVINIATSADSDKNKKNDQKDTPKEQDRSKKRPDHYYDPWKAKVSAQRRKPEWRPKTLEEWVKSLSPEAQAIRNRKKAPAQKGDSVPSATPTDSGTEKGK